MSWSSNAQQAKNPVCIVANHRVYRLNPVDKVGKALPCRLCTFSVVKRSLKQSTRPDNFRLAGCVFIDMITLRNIGRQISLVNSLRKTVLKTMMIAICSSFQTNTKVPFNNIMRAHFSATSSKDLSLVFKSFELPLTC